MVIKVTSLMVQVGTPPASSIFVSLNNDRTTIILWSIAHLSVMSITEVLVSTSIIPSFSSLLHHYIPTLILPLIPLQGYRAVANRFGGSAHRPLVLPVLKAFGQTKIPGPMTSGAEVLGWKPRPRTYSTKPPTFLATLTR